MNRMIIASVIMITTIVVFIISYFIIALPLEYTVDALLDAYDATGYDVNEIKPTMLSFPYFLAAGVVFGCLLSFLWYFTYGHKKEYERY